MTRHEQRQTSAAALWVLSHVYGTDMERGRARTVPLSAIVGTETMLQFKEWWEELDKLSWEMPREMDYSDRVAWATGVLREIDGCAREM